MLSVRFEPPAAKYIKKLKDKKLKTLYREAIDKICNDYTIGEAKTGDLSGFYGYDIYYNKTNYELAYTIERVGEELVVVVMAGTRENFYDQLKQYMKNTIQEYTAEAVADKSTTAVQQYQTRYMERRQAFENGENVPEYLNQDFFTASAKGIGQGALNNTNMTMDEKAEFISQWKEDAQKFEDRDIVTKDVNESLAKKPEYKELAEKVRVIDEKKAVEQVAQKNTEKDTIKTETTTANISAPEHQTVTQVSQKSEPQVIRHQNDTNTKPAKQVTSNTVTNPLTQNNQEIAKDIQALGIDNAIKEYGHKAVISTVLDNQNLKHMRPTLAPIIKSYDLQSLEKLVSDCSTSSFLYICSIVNKEYVAELRDERQDLCYSARKIVENMEKQNA